MYQPQNAKHLFIDQSSNINRQARVQLLTLLQNAVCDRKQKTIYCCSLLSNPSDGAIAPSHSTTTTIKPNINKNLGTWKPTKNQCGFRLTLENIFGGEVAKLGKTYKH